MSKLIVITGADGTGKTTLIKRLATEFESCYCASVWDLLRQSNNTLPFKSKSDIDLFLCALTPNSRLLFLAHALRFSIDKALQSDAETILMDSYYYKYFASELALGADLVLLKALIQSFPEPDLLIELQLPLHEILKRKESYSRYECGLAPEGNIVGFESFQEKVSAQWRTFEFKHHYKINASQSIEQVSDEVMDIIRYK